MFKNFFLNRIIPLAFMGLISNWVVASPMSLTKVIPECKFVTPHIVPDAYLTASRRKHGFAWVKEANRKSTSIGGQGNERASNLYDWFRFTRLDLNNDGNCDWYVNLSAAFSSGGDRDSTNILYLGSPKGWLRIGGSFAPGKLDELPTNNEAAYLFGEQVAVIHDKAAHINYFIAWFEDRNGNKIMRPGYRIFKWNEAHKTLELLDK